MTEEDNNQNDQPTDEEQSSDETQTENRKISKEELRQILKEHKKWVESDGKDGKKAELKKANLGGANLQKAFLYKTNLQKTNLRGANLRKADLLGANLQKAFLVGANLQGADLKRADLQKAFLKGANLQKADLGGADLQKADLAKADMQYTVLDGVKGLGTANLQYANLEGATGLLGNEFAQADVTGTKLPDDIKEFKALETVKETSQNARKIFFAMLLGCVYSWLTIATTTDVRLLTNTASSPLPIIQTEIPIAGFYWAAPLVLICLYVYFHLYLDYLWKGLAGLPAIFPDGKSLDQTAYPWLLNSLVCRHFEKLKKRPIFAHMKEWITIFLAWAVVPFTMIGFWLRYITRHDWFGTCLHISLIILSVGFALIFYRLCALTLQGKEKVIFKIQKFWTNRRFYYDGACLVIVGILFLLLSYGAIEGIRYNENHDFKGIKIIIPWTLKKMGYDVFADFREKSVSEKPDNFGLIAKEERIEFVKGTNLKNRNLKNADMFKAFLVKANLSDSNLKYAHLVYANLQNANILNTDLQSANLYNADLQNANLTKSNLKNAILRKANLQNANLDSANLQNADLQGAMLKNANLDFADLQNADLQDANLMGVNLRWANLSIEQLSKVKTLYQAELNLPLKEQIETCCPQLLKELVEESDQIRELEQELYQLKKQIDEQIKQKELKKEPNQTK